jgi:ABC-type nitrate/sulfonate/bicarbonate transport system substrate-binding protein
MTEALSAHRIDAALVSEPFLEAARKSGRILGYPYDNVSKEFLTTIWYTTTQWASAHPDLAKRFAAVMRETAIWANKRENQTRRAEIIQVLRNATGDGEGNGSLGLCGKINSRALSTPN